MYPLLFGTLSLEVMPSTIARLPFSAKHTYRDFQLCLGMEGNDLLIRATQGSKSFDLIPRRLLELKLPTAFTENYIHWYNYVDNTIEFRSSNDPWCTSSTNWCLQKIGQFWRLNKPGVTLVSLSSETQSALSTILSPLESKHHIHIQLDHYSQCLDIDLPRLELSFRVGHRSSRVESRQYGGTYVDPDQECGVLVGLSSKLILMGSYENRLVLIPEGSVSCSKAHHHVAVRVDENTVTKVHAYQLDTTLGRLVYDGSLQGRLYLAYLHALTSFCLPDPLTGHTGTESAISILRSSAVRSFNVLSEDNIRTLKLISKLSPARGYYPQNEKVMQQVDWDKNLSFLSQDSRFYTLVQEIFTQTQATELLYPSETFTPPSALQHINPELLQRDILRSALFRVSGYGAEDYTTHSDRKYQSRDSNLSSDRGKRSFVAARLVIRQNAALHYKSHEQLYEKLKSQYFKAGVINGPSVPFPRLEFDMEWLSDASSRISESWCGLHCSLASSATDHHNKFDIIMWLCMMAFAENADMDVVEIFSAAYRMGELRSVDIPQERKFDLSVGSSPCLTTLKDLLHSASRRFNNCPDATLPIQIGETETALRQRRAHSFEYNRDRALSALAQALKDQWPCRRPNQIIPDGVATYLDFPDAMNKIYGSFEAWYSNRNFYLYLRDLCSRLGRLVVEEVIVNPILVAEAPTPPAGRGRRYISNTDIFASPVPSLKPGDLGLSVTLCLQRSKYSRFGSRLAKLCQDLDSLARTKSEREYVMDLKRSFTALQKSSNDHRSVTAIQEDADSLAAYLRDCEEYFRYMTERLQAVAQGELQQSHRFLAAYIKNFPRICPSFWVQQLNKKHWDNLSEEWKHVIVEYGLVITDLQRARRLSRVSSNSTELLKEVLNRGHLNWDPYEFPEALLLEIESGIMIREVQEEIAGLMRDPPNNENAVMQLNMGEGKSTVIVPLVAALLADSTK